MEPGTVYVIAGSREYPKPAFVKQWLDRHLLAGDVVIVGGARGVDTWAEEQAIASGCRVERMAANWDAGKGAGFARNIAMLERLVKARSLGWTCHVVVFWDGQSRGTQHTIEQAQARGFKPIFPR